MNEKTSPGPGGQEPDAAGASFNLVGQVPTNVVTIPSNPTKSRGATITKQDYFLLREGSDNPAQRWRDIMVTIAASALLGIIAVLATLSDPVTKLAVFGLTLLGACAVLCLAAFFVLRHHAARACGHRRSWKNCVERVEQELGIKQASTDALTDSGPMPERPPTDESSARLVTTPAGRAPGDARRADPADPPGDD